MLFRSLQDDGISYPGVKVDGNTFTGNAYSSVISSAFTDVLGANISDINVDGGAYVGIYSSHAPEELVPGQMRDSLNISVYTNDSDNIEAVTETIAYRQFMDMGGNVSYTRISDSATTTLAEDLSLTDGSIKTAAAT